MAISMKVRFNVGDRVRFRAASVSVPAQYLPRGLVGEVKAAYLEPYGVSMREHIDIKFLLPDADNRAAPVTPVELRSIPADQLERVE